MFGCVGAGGREVSGGREDFGVSKSLLGEIPGGVISEGGGETFGDDGGAIWFLFFFDLGIVSYLGIEYEMECLEQAPFIEYSFE
ncbi:hypothetical protein Tco_0600256 [Tanacetum coccineum]|uniref:NADH dehydrogenase subunit 3 n=1 Tax=Tanacetum coccineum TaxID=301880 RepID=A0ABQ4WBA7_9ASTR